MQMILICGDLKKAVARALRAGLLLLLPSLGLAAEEILGASQNFAAEMDEVVSSYLEKGEVPGVAVVVVAQDEIVLREGYGIARLPAMAVTPETPFSIGSVTKPFVGIAIVRLAERGLLELDAPVRNYLTDFTPQNPYPTVLTIRHLLNHSSGFSTYVGNLNQIDTQLDPNALQGSLVDLNEVVLQSEPGTRHEYSNANYRTLGVLIERMTDQPFPQAMRALVFDPMGLDHTRVGHDFNDPEAASGFRFWGFSSVPYHTPLGSTLEPQGGISSSAVDLGIFLMALIGSEERAPIWSDSWAIGVPTGSENSSYGLGWSVWGTGDEQIIYHHGLNPGFSAALAFSPAQRRGIAVLANASDGHLTGDVNLVIEDIVALMFPELGVHPVDRTLAWIQIGLCLLIVCSMFIWMLRTSNRWRQSKLPRVHWLRALLPSAIPLAMAYLIGIWLPPNIGITAAGAAMFTPDIGLSLQAVVWSCAGWGILRALLVLPWPRNPGLLA